jgi:hypothetical protein
LINYLKHPIREIAHVPDWTWSELICVQVVITALTGVLTGVVGKSFLGVLSGFFLTPILTMITIAVSSLFFYYLFQVFAGQTLPFRRLATVVFFANLPFFIFQVLSGLVAAVSLIGFAFTAVILIVGFVENFQLPRRLVVRVIVGLYVAIFLVWIWGRWDSLQIGRDWRSERMEAPEVHLGE